MSFRIGNELVFMLGITVIVVDVVCTIGIQVLCIVGHYKYLYFISGLGIDLRTSCNFYAMKI